MISNYSLLPNVEPSIAKTIALKSLITKQLSGGMKNTDEINNYEDLVLIIILDILFTELNNPAVISLANKLAMGEARSCSQSFKLSS